MGRVVGHNRLMHWLEWGRLKLVRYLNLCAYSFALAIQVFGHARLRGKLPDLACLLLPLLSSSGWLAGCSSVSFALS